MPKPKTRLPPQEVTPDPVLEKRVRRVFTTDYKLRILREADSCAHGDLGELLRREKLYHAQLSQWRKEFAASGVEGLSKTAPGPKPTLSADAKRIAQLEKENQRLQRELLVKAHCLELQKKPCHSSRPSTRRSRHDFGAGIGAPNRPSPNGLQRVGYSPQHGL